LHAYGGGKPLIHAFEVRHGEEEVDLGTLAVEPYQYQTLIGRPAPDLHIADARGVPKDFKLSSLRGKWVALFFWNHRMEANGHILPAYAELYETRKDARDRFEIIVVHNSDDVLTVGDYDRAVWRKEIPKFSMPLVIDDREKSFETYGLERGPQFRTAPSEFLVDPEGNVAAYGFDVFWKLLEVFGRKKSAER
jgi:peroxiredoxin